MMVRLNLFSISFQLDNLLFWLFPSRWVPLYTSVTFSRMRYSHCISNRKWQDDLLDTIIKRVGIFSGIAVLGFGYLYVQKRGVNSLVDFSR